MSEVVDRRVVSMEMNNEQFKREAEATIKELEKLEKSVDTKGMEKNLSSLEKVTSSISLDGLAKAVDKINYRFSALGTVTDQIFRNITNSAILAGKRMIKALSTDPLMDGLSEYETEINAVKVIMANLPGVTQEEVNDTLAELNEYADLTVYNFGQMTDAIGKFTAAGVDLKTSTATIKGLANVAAGAGVSNTRLAGAYIQVSQALQAGVFKLQDWNSMQQAGLANEEFRNRLQDTAIEMGILTGRVDNFRDSLKDGWLTTEVFTKTLEKAASTDNEWGKRLTAAATEVTTLTQLIGVLKEALGTAWATSIKYVIGDFTEAKALFTGISDILSGIISGSAEARNIALKEWHDMGGREELLKSLANLFAAIYSIIYPIKKAFNDTFQSITGTGLLGLTRSFSAFTKSLIQNEDVMNGIYSIAKVLATALKAVFTVIKMGLGVLGTVLKVAGSLLQALVIIVGNLAALVIPLTQAIKQSKIFQRLMAAFNKIGNRVVNTLTNIVSAIAGFVAYVLQLPILGDIFNLLYSLIYKVADAIVTIVEAIADFDIHNIGGWFNDLVNKLSQIFSFSKEFKTLENIIKGFGTVVSGVIGGIIGLLGTLISTIFNVGSEFKTSFSFFDIGNSIGGAFVSAISFIIQSFRNLGAGIKSAFSSDKTGQIQWVIDKIIGLKDTIVDVVKSIVNTIKKINWNKLFAFTISMGLVISLYQLSSGLRSIGEGIESLSDAAKILSKALKKKFSRTQSTIRSIAILIGTLTASIKVLSTIPAEDLKKATISLATIMGIFLVFEAILVVMELIVKKLKLGVRMQMATKSIAAIGIAVAAMAASLYILKDVPAGWDLVGKMTALLTLMVVFGGVITVASRFGGNKLTNFLSILAMAFAIDKIVDVFAKFADVPLDDIKDNIKNFIGLMAGLAVLFLGIGQIKIRGVVGLIAMAYSIDAIIEALEAFGKADLSGLRKQLLLLSPLLIALGAFCLAALSITKNVKFGGGLATVGAGVMGIAVGVAVLIAALNLFPKEGFDVGPFAELITSLIVIFGAIGVLIGVIGSFNKAADGKALKGAAGTLLTMAVLVGSIALSLAVFALIKDPADILAGMVAISTILISFKYLLKEINGMTSAKRAVLVLVLMIAELAAITISLSALMAFDWGQLALRAVVIASTIAALATIATIFAKKFNFPTGQIVKSLATLGIMTAIFAILGVVLGALNRLAPDATLFMVQAGSIVVAIGMMALIIGLLSQFGGDNVAVAGSALMKVSIGIAALAAGMALLGAVDIRTGTIWAFVGAVTVLTAVFGVLLAVIQYANLEPALLSLSAFVNGISEALLNFGKSAALFGVAVLAFAKALQMISQIGQEEQQNIINTFTALGTGIISAVGVIIIGLVDLLTMGLYTLVYNAVETIKHIFSPEDAQLITMNINNGVISIIDSAGNAIASASLKAGQQAKESLEQNMPGEKEGKEQAKSYTNSFTSGTQFSTTQRSEIAKNAGAGTGYFVNTVEKDVAPKARVVEEEASKLPEAQVEGLTKISATDTAEVREAAAQEVNAWYASAEQSLNDTEISMVKDWKKLDDVTSTNMLYVLKHIYEDGNQILIDANGEMQVVSRETGESAKQTIQDYFGVVDANMVFYSEEAKQNAKEAGKKPWDGFVEGFVDQGNQIINQLNSQLGSAGIDLSKGIDLGSGDKVAETFYNKFLPKDEDKDGAESFVDDLQQKIEDITNSFGDLGSSSGAGGATKAVKEFEDTIVEIPDINDTVNSSMEKFIISFAKAQETIANPDLLPALQSGYNEFIEMQYNTWAATDDGIQTIKEEEEEIARLTEEALEAGVDFDAEAKRTQYRLRDMANAWNELRNTLVDTVQGQIDIFSEFDKKTELSSEQLINNMRSQIEGVKEWADNLTILTQRGLSEGLLQKLSEMGPQGYEYVHAFVEMTADQLNQANQLFAQSTTLSDETADQLLANYVYAGAMTSAGFMQGIVDGQTDVNAACENMGLSGLAALKSVLQIQSPSQETYAVGSYLIQGLVNGITDFQESALTTMRELGKALIESMIEGMKYERLFVKTTAEELAKNGYDSIRGKWQGYYDAGVYVIQRFIDGMNSKYDDLAAAASALSSLTLGTMSGVLEEASPSRATFKIGAYATEGFILGVNSYADQVNESTSNLGYIAANNLRNAILAISEGVETDLNMDPTIRPVLDLSRVTPQAQRINAMFSRNLAIKANADVQRAGIITDSNGTTVAGSQYVFNQYNTSPRALDRVEIYRQTRNQFASFRGMTE